MLDPLCRHQLASTAQQAPDCLRLWIPLILVVPELSRSDMTLTSNQVEPTGTGNYQFTVREVVDDKGLQPIIANLDIKRIGRRTTKRMHNRIG